MIFNFILDSSFHPDAFIDYSAHETEEWKRDPSLVKINRHNHRLVVRLQEQVRKLEGTVRYLRRKKNASKNKTNRR